MGYLCFQLIAVATTMVGVIVISLDKEFVGYTFGVFLSVLSALFAALYRVNHSFVA